VSREVRLWEFLRDGLKGTEGLHMRRVENQVGVGDPDVDGCYQGCYFEIELKGTNRPAHASTPIDLGIRKSQVIWHRKRTRCGGNNWLYIRIGVGAGVRRYLVPGKFVPALAACNVTEAALGALAVLPPVHTAEQVLFHIRASKNC
jgi:hypothetical protein